LTGFHFSAGNVEDLAAKAEWAWSHPCELEMFSRNARAEYESKYTAERNYEHLARVWNRLGIQPGS
jgi:glycosyltransferase involved in cell wall biosynthesis